MTNGSFTHWVRVLLIVFVASLGAEAFEIVPAEKWSGVFGESKVTFSFRVEAVELFNGTANWSYSANRRTLRSGETKVEGGMLTIALTTPRATDGVVMETTLAVGIDDGRDTARFEKTVWLFPRDPFFERTEWLSELQVKLFDPVGDTAEVFGAASIPYDELRNLAAIEGVEEGVVVLGEGVSLQTNKHLHVAAAILAAKGVPVLFLAPSDGSLTVPGTADSGLPSPNQLSFRRNDVIQQLDKRLDSEGWPPRGELAVSRFKVKSERREVVAEVSEDGEGWPWLEFKFENESTLAVCGFGIIKHWQSGPAPRFLLARLFEKLEKKQDETESQSDSKEKDR